MTNKTRQSAKKVETKWYLRKVNPSPANGSLYEIDLVVPWMIYDSGYSIPRVFRFIYCFSKRAESLIRFDAKTLLPGNWIDGSKTRLYKQCNLDLSLHELDIKHDSEYYRNALGHKSYIRKEYNTGHSGPAIFCKLTPQGKNRLSNTISVVVERLQFETNLN
jgi:hypothetical protein